MTKAMIDLYSDYLLTAFRQTSATKLSSALDGAISHDKITRELGGEILTSSDYWKYIKPTIRAIQEDKAMIAIDDFILEKPDSEENSVVAYYYDHKTGTTVKGTNVVDAAYITSRGRIPLDFEVVSKDMIPEFDWDKGEYRRVQDKSKNLIAQEILKRAKLHQVLFKTVLLDTWFASSETMNMIKLDLGKEFIVALKSNRKVKLLTEPALMTGLPHDKKGFVQIDLLELEQSKAYLARVEGVKPDVLLTRQVFTDKDERRGVLYLAASELCLTDEGINAGYHARWQVEEQHKSGKQNAMMGKGAASWVMGRVNHIFCAFVALVKLEKMRLKLNLNHFALKERLYLSALRASMTSLTELRALMEFREKPA